MQSLQNNAVFSETENGDKAFSTSGNNCLDFFTQIVRNAPMLDYISAFNKAWAEDRECAVRLLMNLRDVRDGKGEKLIPAVILVHLRLSIAPSVYEDILRQMVEYGYWKDVLRVLEIYTRTVLSQNKTTAIEKTCIEIRLFAEQLSKDEKILDSTEPGKNAIISLCGKWAPSENTHFDHTPLCFAKGIAEEMAITPKQYRQLLTRLRKHLGVLEMLMSTDQYDKIDFSKIPSIAVRKMKTAFMRGTNADGKESDNRKALKLSYQEFLKNLISGKTKVNIKGTQPHELASHYFITNRELDGLIEGQWQELIKRTKSTGTFRDCTAVVDVSSSMSGQPMEVSVALGILLAECVEGPFHGQVITFHQNPTWHRLTGSTLQEKVRCMKSAQWGGSTNMRRVFDLILAEARAANLKQSEMIKTIFIFTDMQFNGEVTGGDNWQSTFEYARQEYNRYGYTLPRIVCWNLRTSSAKTMPVTQNEEGFCMLSGFSAELMKCVITGQDFSPLAMMQHVLEPYTAPESVKTCSAILANPVPLSFLEVGITKSQLKKAFKKSDTITGKPSVNLSNSSSDSESD